MIWKSKLDLMYFELMLKTNFNGVVNMTEVKEKIVDLNVEEIPTTEEEKEPEEKEEKRSFWDYFTRYPGIPFFFGH